MNFHLIYDNIDLYITGLQHTLILVSLSLTTGLFFAIPLAVFRTSKNIFIYGPISAFTYFFRGTPLLVQMFLIYYGMGQFEFIRSSFLWQFFKEAYLCALLSFSLNTCAYTIEIIRGAIENTPQGEIEAAKAAGMSLALRFRRIILPSAFRRALPSYGNEIIFMLHATSLASVITITDITGAAMIVNSRYYTPYEAFLTAALIYMTITFILVWLTKRLEIRWFAHLR